LSLSLFDDTEYDLILCSDQLYMDRIHEFIPIIHQAKYAAWCKSEQETLSNAQKALRYAMWTVAASASPYQLIMRDSLYYNARRAIESLDSQSNVKNPVETEIVQAWLLLAVYELKWVGFSRAWLSAGRALRLIQLDPLWVTFLGNADHRSWVDTEEHRRTFWFAYCLDRLMSLRNGTSPTLTGRV
jgi:hypothetical protein